MYNDIIYKKTSYNQIRTKTIIPKDHKIAIKGILKGEKILNPSSLQYQDLGIGKNYCLSYLMKIRLAELLSAPIVLEVFPN